MFETDLDQTISQSYIRKYSEKFFPVVIIQKPDYLLVDDKRIDSQIILPAFFIFMSLPVFILILGVFFAQGWWILTSTIFAALFSALTYWLLSVSFGQRLIFYKDQDRYEIIKKRLFSFAKKSGDIGDIKEVNIEVNWYKNEDRAESFSSQAFLVLEYGAKDLIVRETFGNDFRTTTKIVFAITDYLRIPYSETENRHS